MIKLRDCNKTGLFAEHKGIAPVEVKDISLTTPAREALEAAGAKVVPMANSDGLYAVTLGATVPSGIVAATIHDSGAIGVRMESDPPYPGENPDQWVQLLFTPCPKCGAPLIWYEAGYVPGYRVCAQKPHHHFRA